MKRILAMIFLVLLSSMVLAQGQQGVHELGTGIEQPEVKEAGSGQGLKDEEATPVAISEPVKAQTKAKDMTQLNEMVQEKKQEMEQEMEGMGNKEQKVYQNQNRVREAVHALLAMEDLVGGIGPQISEIARNFNNSVQATIRVEEKIQTRNALARFFSGGDAEAADEIESEVTQNQLRVQELNQLREQCECDEEVMAMIQEQIQNMEQEQTRLQELAQSEKASKGLLGWIWK